MVVKFGRCYNLEAGLKQAVLLKDERKIKTSIQGLRRKKRKWLKSLATYAKLFQW